MYLKYFSLKKIFLLIFITCLLIFMMGIYSDISGKTNEPFLNDIFWKTIKGGVEDTSWWNAKSKDEVELILSRYYTGSLLNEVVKSSWDFIRKPTDWYWQVSLDSIEIKWQYDNLAGVSAILEDNNLITGDSEKGDAQFVLEKTKEGWRILSSSYYWPANDERITIR